MSGGIGSKTALSQEERLNFEAIIRELKDGKDVLEEELRNTKSVRIIHNILTKLMNHQLLILSTKEVEGKLAAVRMDSDQLRCVLSYVRSTD